MLSAKKGKDALQRAGCKISLDCSDICEEPPMRMRLLWADAF